jgi:uncharacterized membrane protein YqjE
MSTSLLESVQNVLAGVLDLGRTRFELFGTEMREELAHLASTVLGGLAVLVLAALGLAFSGFAFIFSVDEANRLWATIGVALVFFLGAGILALWLRRTVEVKPRAFDATIAELQRDLNAIRQ